MKRLTLSFVLLLAVLHGAAQVPADYYNGARGLSGEGLKTALFRIISPHTDVGYDDSLYDVYADSDLDPDGHIYDMYSNITSYGIGDYGSYSKEGDHYNREHTVPQSWFNKKSPMRADAFHVVPTDGYINNMRGSFPYGETASPEKTSANGYSRKGPCSVPGYTGTVFEPNDEYKGDIARIYFYMATCYEDKIGSWSGGIFGQGTYPGIVRWQLDMLLRWAAEDPVSQREVDRNEGVCKHQKNRNPFVDFPGLEQYVWGDRVGEQFDPDNYGGAGTVDELAPDVPAFSEPSGTVEAGTEIVISCATEGANIQYYLNGGGLQTAPSPVSITLDATARITARAEKDGHYSRYTSATYTVRTGGGGSGGGNVFTRVTSAAELVAGREYLVVCEDYNTALGAQGSDIRSSVAVSISNGVIETETGTATTPHALTLGGSAGAWTFYDAAEGVFLSLNSADNKLHTAATADAANAKWRVTATAAATEILSSAYTDRLIQYNSTHPRFACYTGSQRAVCLYLREEGQPVAPEVPQFSEPGGGLEVGTEVTITCPTEGAALRYTVNGGDEQEAAASVSFILEEDTRIEAYAVLDGLESEHVFVEYIAIPVLEAPQFSPESGEEEAGAEVTITSQKEGASIRYSVNGLEEQESHAPVIITVDGYMSIEACAVLDGEMSEYA
ncbi:MAG: endonuclease, partial [Alloprevotella sp.]|nr:endonuclease [Alloprevotella sp.]